ncbi:MAG: ABC transporter permease, partial [Candidatus Electrothrix sp. AR3]|nr:ABC transporter permease [Candidatus Electrothrix sp. AR3]
MRKDIQKKQSPARRRWRNFKKNKRGFYSLILFSFLFLLSLFAEVFSNDKPFLIRYEGGYYFPLFKSYPETMFGGDFETEADYRDPYIMEKLTADGNKIFFPLNPYSYNSINFKIDQPVPAPPSKENILGTDDRGRDVLARLLYGFRLSVLFGFALTFVG